MLNTWATLNHLIMSSHPLPEAFKDNLWSGCWQTIRHFIDAWHTAQRGIYARYTNEKAFVQKPLVSITRSLRLSIGLSFFWSDNKFVHLETVVAKVFHVQFYTFKYSPFLSFCPSFFLAYFPFLCLFGSSMFQKALNRFLYNVVDWSDWLWNDRFWI